jgi:hypothetical protein
MCCGSSGSLIPKDRPFAVTVGAEGEEHVATRSGRRNPGLVDDGDDPRWIEVVKRVVPQVSGRYWLGATGVLAAPGSLAAQNCPARALTSSQSFRMLDWKMCDDWRRGDAHQQVLLVVMYKADTSQVYDNRWPKKPPPSSERRVSAGSPSNN